ncbi:MAG: hypothetical protein U5L96_17540 [Owenweeksia sp.]|nr:hypothetical protein [Owenweeksia sp.]
MTFNEPVEQLLLLASQKLRKNKPLRNFRGSHFSKLAEEHQISKSESSFNKQIEDSLYPLDVISATALTTALQRYGQNERSLSSFLQIEADPKVRMDLPKVYDYLLKNFYTSLQNSSAHSFNHWRLIERGIERVEFEIKGHIKSASAIVKTTGLLQIFTPNAKVDDGFLTSYLKDLPKKK